MTYDEIRCYYKFFVCMFDLLFVTSSTLKCADYDVTEVWSEAVTFDFCVW